MHSRILALLGPTRDFCKVGSCSLAKKSQADCRQHWQIGRRCGTHAGGVKVLVYKRFGRLSIFDQGTSMLTAMQKYVKGKPCKPYNSTLGEFFRVSAVDRTSNTS